MKYLVTRISQWLCGTFLACSLLAACNQPSGALAFPQPQSTAVLLQPVEPTETAPIASDPAAATPQDSTVQPARPTSSPFPPSATPTARLMRPRTATPRPTPFTELTCLQQGGKIETGQLGTDLLRLPMDFRLYLPPCYDQLPQQRYPVLILIHGQSYTDDQWDRLGADEAADRLIAAGQIAPLIIVMPRDRFGGQPTENNFARVVVEELLPYLDRNYRTLPDRQHRAVGGLSRGAGWAVHLAIVHWQLFGALGAHSPAIFHTDAQQMRAWLDAIPAEQMPRILIDIGDRDRPEIMDSALWFEQVLNDKDIPHDWYLFSGYHSEEYWAAHVEQYLLWYARDW